MKKIGIYKITNTVNGKVYIGQSVDLKKRIRVHKRYLRLGIHDNEHLQNAYNKYGEESLKYSVLEECKIEELDNKEIQYIQDYNSTNKHKGYNVFAGGQARHDCPEETRKKIGAKNTGHTRVMPEEEKQRRSLNWHKIHRAPTKESIAKANATKNERRIGWGEKNANAILSDVDAVVLLNMMIAGATPKSLSTMFDYPIESLYNLYYGRSYKHLKIEGRDSLKDNVKRELENKIDQAVNLYITGMSQDKIAHEIHISRNTLRRELKNRGIDTQLHRNQFA